MEGWYGMDKDLLKGLALVLGVVAAVGAVFVLASASGPQKARCIANALKAGVAYANIDKTCNLTQHSY
jgi:predicted anti-sigma-YlaC factor YlaD